MKKFALTFLLCTLFSLAYAQKKGKEPVEKLFPTGTTDHRAQPNIRRNAPDQKYYRYIIKNRTKNTLYGNDCATAATRRMGFEYVVQSKKAPGSYSTGRRYWNNFKVKSRLFFLRTPLWKFILKSRLKKCRQRTGDKTG